MVDLVDGLKKCGIPENAAEPLAQKMEAYIKEIVLFNSAYNLRFFITTFLRMTIWGDSIILLSQPRPY